MEEQSVIIREGSKFKRAVKLTNGKPKDHHKYYEWTEEKEFTVIRRENQLFARWEGWVAKKKRYVEFLIGDIQPLENQGAAIVESNKSEEI